MLKKRVLPSVIFLTAGLLPVHGAELLLYFNFDDNTDPTTTVEVSGNGPDAALVGPAAFSADAGGVFGTAGDRALDLGGVNNGAAASVPAGNHLLPAELGDAMAISFWQYNTQIGNTSSFWVISPTATSNQRGFQAHTPWGNGTIFFDHSGCCGTPGQRLTDGGGNIVLNQWQHFVFQKGADGSKEFWVDGVKIAEQAAGADSLMPLSGEVTIGGEGTAFLNSFGGLIDEFAVYSGVLTADEIAMIAEADPNLRKKPNDIATPPADSDGGGLPDWYEDQVGLDKANAADDTADGDGDGLDNVAEFSAGTNPLVADTDADGSNDGDEITNGTNPLVADTDGDGLSDGEEATAGTDPLLQDTDGDLMFDGFEVQFGLDPNDATGDNGFDGDPDGDTIINGDEELFGTNPTNDDTDGDGLKDNVETDFGFYVDEFDTGTNPTNPDSDGDGLPDGVEIPTLPFVDANQPGTDPNMVDTDFDGFGDGFEIAEGTDPTDAFSFPQAGDLELLAHWNFDDVGDPANAVDTVGGVSGGLENGAAYTADMGGRTGVAGDYAMDFAAGANANVRILDVDFLNDATIYNELTIAFWQKLNSTGSTSSFWGHSPSSSGTQRGIQAHVPWGGGTIYFDQAGCCDGTQRLNGPPAAGHNWNEWHHYAFVKRGEAMEVWIDGVKVLEKLSGAAPMVSDFTRFHIGSNNNPSNGIDGVIDDFVIYNRGLGSLALGLLTNGVAPDVIPDLGKDDDGDGLADGWEDQFFGNGDGVAEAAELAQQDGAGDPDGDGLSNQEEFDQGLDPTKADTDDDGLNDGDELTEGTDPKNPDSDNDTLLDGAEVNTHMTNPLDPDSDFDGMLDGWEVANGLDPNVDDAFDDLDNDGLVNLDEDFLGTNPMNPDTDGDGLLDGVESNFGVYIDETDTGTDPANPDTDGDGLPDGVEVPTLPFVDVNQPGTDPTLVDTDLDGFPDGLEIKLGTDPTDNLNFPLEPGPLQLVAYWDFNNAGDPNTAVDSQNGLSAAVQNGAVYTADGGGHTGEVGDHAMDLAPTGSANLHLPDAGIFNESTAFDELTISFWQKLTGTPNSSTFWFVSPASNGTARGLQAHVPWSNNRIYFDTAGCCAAPSQRLDGPTPGGFAWTDWHHFAFVKNGDRKEIWIDGVLFLEQTGTGALPSDITELWLGSAQNGGNSLAGAIDDFAVFSRGLDQGQIEALAGGTSPTEIAGGTPQGPGLALTGVSYANDQTTITWSSRPGMTYTVYTSTDLQGDPTTWADLNDNVMSGGDTTSFTDMVSPAGPMRFYKVFENPPTP